MKATFTYKLAHPGYEAEGEASITPEQYGAICKILEGTTSGPEAPKWIDDPHDIEQGRMLNPAWVALRQGTEAADLATVLDFISYQRKMQWLSLPAAEMAALDRIIAARQKHEKKEST